MQLMACRSATEQLSAYFSKTEINQAALEAAMDHLAQCPDCAARVGHLVKALQIDEEDRLTCQECEDALPTYLQAESAGNVPGPRWQAITLHLKTCPHCSDAYATLSELTAFAFGEKGSEPPRYPAPNLPFMTQDHQQPWRLDDLGRLIIQFSADLIASWQPSAPTTAATGLRSEQSTQMLGQYSLKTSDVDFEVTLTAETEPNAPTQCKIITEVNIPSRGGWPNLADTEVVLKRNAEELSRQMTDAFGKAIFTDVAVDDLPALVFEIVPDEEDGG